MAIPGQLSKAGFGYTMPSDAPLYAPFPLYYEDTRILMYPYLTDAARAAALVPAPLEVITVDPAGTMALAEVVCARYPFSNIGAYNEVAQTIAVTYKGAPGSYAVRLNVTSDQALTAGREIGGFPKKLGLIRFDETDVFACTLDAPDGLRICSAEMAALQPIPWLTQYPVTYYSLRLIPDPTNAAQHSVSELVQSTWLLDSGKFWSARGMLSFTGASALHPYHTLAIAQLLGPMNTAPPQQGAPVQPGLALFRGNMRVEQVSIVETY